MQNGLRSFFKKNIQTFFAIKPRETIPVIIKIAIIKFLALSIFTGCSATVSITDMLAGTETNVTLDIQEVSSGVSLTEGSSIVLIVSQSETRNQDTVAKISISANSDNAEIESIFNSNNYNLQISSNSKTGSVAINTNHISKYTGDQKFILNLTSTDSKITTKKNQIEITIKDAEDPPVVKFNSNSQNISEGAGSGVATVTMNRAASFPITVNYSFVNNTAIKGTDFAGTNSSITFAAGETTKTISYTVTDNAVPGAAKDFSIQLTSITSPATLSATEKIHTVNILDNDTATLSINGGSVAEGNNLIFTVNMSPVSTQTVTVDYATADGTAVAGTQYVSKSGTLTFAAGDSSKTISVTTTANAGEICASDKNFTIQLSNAAQAGIGTSSATGTITDPDIPSVSLADTSGTEGNNIVFTASLSAACSTKNVSFNWATSSGTAISNTDFGAVNSAASVTAGTTTVTLPVTTIQNSIYEGDKNFTVSLSSFTNATAGSPTSATGTIHDDELPLGSFSVSGITAASGDSTSDAFLVNATSPKVNWSASTNATSYDVTIYDSTGNSVVCATQNTTSTNFDFAGGSCNLSTNTDYKAGVVAKLGAQTQNASNNKYSFHVNASPTLGSGGAGPWYVMQGGSITINAAWAASPSVGIATDAEGDSFSITNVGTTTFGASVTNNSSNLVYTAGASANGKDTFSFTITDAKGGTLTTTMTIHVMTAYTWTGGGGINTWSSAGKENWCGTINTNKNGCVGLTGVPGASNVAVIDDTCTGSFCSPTNNYNVSVQGLKITGSQFTQGAGYTLTIGSSGFTQTAGIFTGGNSAISSGGAISITGGDFTSTSNTFTYSGNSLTISAANLFHHNNGTFSFSGSSVTRSVSANNVDFYHVNFAGYYDQTTLSANINVLGNLTLSDTYNGGSGKIDGSYINLYGHLTTSNYGKSGNTEIKIVGNSNQTLTGISGANIPKLTIESTGGTVSFSGTLYLTNNFTYTSGTVDAGTSTVYITSKSAKTINANSMSFYNFTFGGWYVNYTLSSPMTVLGTLTLADTYNGYSGGVNGSYINAKGDITCTNYGQSGTTVVYINGNTNQTISGASGAHIPNLNINSSGGTVTFTGSFSLYRDFTYTSGTVDFGTSSLSFSSGNDHTISASNLNFYDLILSGSNSDFTISSSFNVYGTLTINDSYSGTINGNTIYAFGNVTATNNGKAGTTLIKLVGSSNQTVTGSTNTSFPSLEIASLGGTVTFVNTSIIVGNFNYTSGAVDFGTSTIIFSGNSANHTISANGINFNNVTFAGSLSTTTLSTNINILGTVIFSETWSGAVNGYTINAYGNVTTTGNGNAGTTNLVILGNNNTSLTCSGISYFPGSMLTIQKDPGATVNLTTNCSYNRSGQNLTVASGELNLSGYSLTVNNNLTVNVGATLTASGGTYSPSSGAKFSCLGTCNP